MSCDSDEPGALANDHMARLTTSALDCSAQAEVWLKFDSHIGVYTVSAVTGAVVRVSTDNTNWTTYTAYPDLTTSVRWSANPESGHPRHLPQPQQANRLCSVAMAGQLGIPVEPR